MSNKTRLQTNNTNLQVLINKANALPNAGSGSGGGSVEMCAVKVFLDSPSIEVPTVYYTDSNMTVQSTTLGHGQLNLSIPIGTLLLTIGGSSADSVTGSGEIITYGMGNTVYKINGSCTIYVVPM